MRTTSVVDTPEQHPKMMLAPTSAAPTWNGAPLPPAVTTIVASCVSPVHVRLTYPEPWATRFLDACVTVALKVPSSPMSQLDRKSTRLNSSHSGTSYAV